MQIRNVRVLLAVTLAAILSAPMTAFAVRAHAPAPSITVTPTPVLPHGTVSVQGTGFDPSANGKTIIVNVVLVSSNGTFPIGALQTDSNGAINSGSTPLRLPFTVDAIAANQVIATQDGKPGLGASQLVAGQALHPQINNGQALSAKLGDTITITGTGFAPRDLLNLTLGGQPLSTSSGPIATVADDAGNTSVSITLPTNAQAGTQLLTLAGSAVGLGQIDSAGVPLTLAAGAGTVAISPNPATVGASIAVQASGFQPNEPVTFTLRYFDTGLNNFAITNSPANADNSGAAAARISIPVAADPNKPATVLARGNDSGVSSSSALAFASLAQVTIIPPSALPGATITINGSGFISGENLFVTTRLFKPPIGSLATPDATGHFTATETLLTTLQPGTVYPLSISGTGGDHAAALMRVSVRVPPSIRVNPTTGGAGSAVSVTGQGFGGNESLGFFISGNALSTFGTSTADATGAFTVSVVLPSGIAPGMYPLSVRGANTGVVASSNVSVTLSSSMQWYFAEGFTGQGPNVFFHETITVLNPSASISQGTIIYGFPDGHTRSVPIIVRAHAELVEDVNADVGPDQIVSAVVKTTLPSIAARVITRTDAKKHKLDTDVSPGQSVPQSNWYFAEGYSGVTFQPYLTVQNPGSNPISMTVTLFPSAGAPAVVPATIPPFGRYTLNLRSALPGKSFSINVAANQPVIAERVEYWGAGAGSAKFGAGVKPGISSAGLNWYFGYGSILGGDQSFLSILNPTSSVAHVKASIFDGTGGKPRSTTLTVLPGQRGTIQLHQLFGGAKHSPVAVRVTSDTNVVCEEAQYYLGSPNVGSHAGFSMEGRQFAATTWSFASGDTSQYRESIFVFNPSPSATTITGTFYGVDGQSVSAKYAVPANRVVSISSNAVKTLHKGAHGSIWASTGGTQVVVVQSLLANDGLSALGDQGIPG